VYIRVAHITGGGARFHFFPASQTVIDRLEILRVLKQYLKKVNSPRFYLGEGEEKEKEISFEEAEKILLRNDSSETFSFLTHIKREYVAPCFNRAYFFTYFSDGMYGNRNCLISFRPMPANTDSAISKRYDELLGRCFPQNIYPANVGVSNEAVFYNKNRQRFMKKNGLTECEPSYLQVLGSYLQLREREVGETTLSAMKPRIDKDSWNFLKNVEVSHCGLLECKNILSIRGTVKNPSGTRGVKGLDVPVHVFIGLLVIKEEV